MPVAHHAGGQAGAEVQEHHGIAGGDLVVDQGHGAQRGRIDIVFNLHRDPQRLAGLAAQLQLDDVEVDDVAHHSGHRIDLSGQAHADGHRLPADPAGDADDVVEHVLRARPGGDAAGVEHGVAFIDQHGLDLGATDIDANVFIHAGFLS